ncbi:MAG: extracellular solute-binding protein [Deltaproteobacteria bacterium]|nr:extracellular solute-binding protein [Deltaproteobacteria bacterium]
MTRLDSHLFRTTRLLLLGWVILFLPLSGFSQSKEIRFWQFWPEKWIKPEIERFEKQTGIKVIVERLTWSDGLNKIIAALAADQAPDVIEIGSTWVVGFSEGGGLKPLEVDDLKARLNLWKPAEYQGKTYAVPWTLSTGALFYNKKLLDKAGVLDVPSDWNQLLDASRRISVLDERIYGYGLKTGAYSTWQKFLPFAWSNEAVLFDPNSNSATLDSPRFLQAVRYYQELKNSSLFDDNLAVRKAFQEGKIGFMVEEPGQIIKFQKESPELEFGVTSLPKSPHTQKSIAFGGGQMLAITKNTKNLDAANRFIRFLVRPDVTKSITSQVTTLFPSHKSAINDPFYQVEHPELLIFLETLKTASSPASHPKWIDIQEIFSEQLERVMYGLISVEDAMNQAKKDINEILLEPKANVIGDQGLEKDNLTYNLIKYLLIIGALLLLIWGGYYYYNLKYIQKLEKQVVTKKIKYSANTILFLLPWLLVFSVFSVFPIVYSFYLSFTQFKATAVASPKWIGLLNYLNLLSDKNFINSVYNSLIFVIGTVPVIMLLALVLSVILNQKLRFRTFYRVSYFMPVVTSVMVIATLFMELYAPAGFFNDLAGLMGFEDKHWLKDPSWSLPSIMFMNIWASFGFYTLMLLAGLQNIPLEYYEASKLDGASHLRQFFTITLPLLKPTLIVAALMDTILAFQVFGEIFIMTKGGPLRTTETSVYFLYETAFHKQKMGYGSAAAYYVFLVLILFTGGQFILYRYKGAFKNRNKITV